MARPLWEEGVAVAMIRHRLAPGFAHPAHAEDVAAAVAFLLRGAARYGYDPRRIFLAGHSSGAHLAALVALDPRYLEREGLDPSALAGVIALSGIYDLDPGDALTEEERAYYEQAFGDRRTRRAASPLRLVRSDAPRFLCLAAEHDIPGYLNAGNAFAEALRETGHPDAEFYFMLGRDHFSILDMRQTDRGAAQYLLHFVGVRPLPPLLAELDGAARYWRKPRFSSQPFWERGVRVQSFEADERFLDFARGLFLGLAHKKIVWRPRALPRDRSLRVSRAAGGRGAGARDVARSQQRPEREDLPRAGGDPALPARARDRRRRGAEPLQRDRRAPSQTRIQLARRPPGAALPGAPDGRLSLLPRAAGAAAAAADARTLRALGGELRALGGGPVGPAARHRCRAAAYLGRRGRLPPVPRLPGRGQPRRPPARARRAAPGRLRTAARRVPTRGVAALRLRAVAHGKQVGAPGHPVAGAAAQELHELIERERAQAQAR